jgi:DNA-directed RNA polymerase subunit N
MIIPVRCLSCGRPIGGLWVKYKERVDKGEKPGKVLDDLGINSYCCRALFLTHRDTLKKIARYRT